MKRTFRVEVVHAHGCHIRLARYRYICNCGGTEMWKKWLEAQP